VTKNKTRKDGAAVLRGVSATPTVGTLSPGTAVGLVGTAVSADAEGAQQQASQLGIQNSRKRRRELRLAWLTPVQNAVSNRLPGQTKNAAIQQYFAQSNPESWAALSEPERKSKIDSVAANLRRK